MVSSACAFDCLFVDCFSVFVRLLVCLFMVCLCVFGVFGCLLAYVLACLFDCGLLVLFFSVGSWHLHEACVFVCFVSSLRLLPG